MSSNPLLIRVVRMTFQPEKVADFLRFFEETKDKISAFPGCHGVELLQDYHQPHIYHTYSTWDSDEALNAYRASALFGSVWRQTKVYFLEPAQAFSMMKV